MKCSCFACKHCLVDEDHYTEKEYVECMKGKFQKDFSHDFEKFERMECDAFEWDERILENLLVEPGSD